MIKSIAAGLLTYTSFVRLPTRLMTDSDIYLTKDAQPEVIHNYLKGQCSQQRELFLILTGFPFNPGLESGNR